MLSLLLNIGIIYSLAESLTQLLTSQPSTLTLWTTDFSDSETSNTLMLLKCELSLACCTKQYSTKWVVSLEEFYWRKGNGVEKFYLVMSLTWFKTVIRFLLVDDRTTRDQRRVFDRLAPVWRIFAKYVENIRKIYCVTENIFMDKMLPVFRGRCDFRQYILSKHANYGKKNICSRICQYDVYAKLRNLHRKTNITAIF